MKRSINLANSLSTLRLAGIDVRTVIDVGVQFDTEVLRTGFANVPHILFEPVAEYYDTIRANYADTDYTLVEAAVGSEPGTLILQNVRSDATTGMVSHVVNTTHESDDTRRVPCITLDGYISDHPLAKPYLLKIDVDGAESHILRSSKRTLQDCSCVIVETTMMDLQERVWLASLGGLKLWDIVDFTFYYGNLYQVDLVFVHEDQLKRHPVLDPYEAINRGLDKSAWFQH